MARTRKGRAEPFAPNAWYRIDNRDGTLAMVVALDTINIRFAIEHYTDPEDGLNKVRMPARYPSICDKDPEPYRVALSAEEEVKAIMRPISFDEAKALAPEWMAGVEQRMRGKWVW